MIKLLKKLFGCKKAAEKKVLEKVKVTKKFRKKCRKGKKCQK